MLCFRAIFLGMLVSLGMMMVSTPAVAASKPQKKLVYIVSDLSIPFWRIMDKGVSEKAKALGYDIVTYGVQNDAKKELEAMMKAINDKVSGIIVSPNNSSSCATLLKLAKNAGIPVVIADIGTEGGEYVSYIASNNVEGAYALGKILAQKMHRLGWQDGRVGIVAIPQKRANGKARTEGFMKAMEEAGIQGAALKQQVTFSYEETYAFTKEMIDTHPNLRAVWLQGSDKYEGALAAIKDAKKQDDILLICFDAEPIFLELIPQKILTGAAMQQPFLMGEEAVRMMHSHLQGDSVEKNKQLPILAISSENIAEKLPIIKRNVLGLDVKTE